MAMPAVRQVDTQGTSVRDLFDERAGQQSVFGELRNRPHRTRERLQRPVKHVEHHEPDGGCLGEAAQDGRERQPQDQHEVFTELLRTQHPSQTRGSTMK